MRSQTESRNLGEVEVNEDFPWERRTSSHMHRAGKKMLEN